MENGVLFLEPFCSTKMRRTSSLYVKPMEIHQPDVYDGVGTSLIIGNYSFTATWRLVGNVGTKFE